MEKLSIRFGKAFKIKDGIMVQFQDSRPPLPSYYDDWLEISFGVSKTICLKIPDTFQEFHQKAEVLPNSSKMFFTGLID